VPFPRRTAIARRRQTFSGGVPLAGRVLLAKRNPFSLARPCARETPFGGSTPRRTTCGRGQRSGRSRVSGARRSVSRRKALRRNIVVVHSFNDQPAVVHDQMSLGVFARFSIGRRLKSRICNTLSVRIPFHTQADIAKLAEFLIKAIVNIFSAQLRAEVTHRDSIIDFFLISSAQPWPANVRRCVSGRLSRGASSTMRSVSSYVSSFPVACFPKIRTATKSN